MIKYTICFCDSEPHLLKPLLKPGFSHCFAINHTEEYYVVINSARSIVEVDVLRKTESAYADLIKGMRTVTVEVDGSGGSLAALRWISCVELVKSLIGIKSATLLTPYQLYKRLKK